jgi:hypothetical protein
MHHGRLPGSGHNRTSRAAAGDRGALSLEPVVSPWRLTDVRSVVTVLALAVLLSGCSGGSRVSSAHPGGDSARPEAALPVPSRSSAPLSAWVALPSRTMTAGSSMRVHVVVQNNTGHALRVPGCLTLFEVVLTSKTYRPAVAWLSCLQTITIPAGESSYPMTLQASYHACSQGPPQDGLQACLPDGGPPPLPPGDYHATLFQVRHLVPAPRAVSVRVTPARPAA